MEQRAKIDFSNLDKIEEWRRGHTIAQLYNSAVSSQVANRRFKYLEEAWNFAAGTGYSQWDQNVKNLALKEGRPIHQKNIIKPEIFRTTGMILSNRYEPLFSASHEMPDMDADLMNNLWELDYDVGAYEFVIADAIRDGVINQFVMEAYIDKRYRKNGRPGFRIKNPTAVLPEPAWQSDDIADCSYIFTHTWKNERGLLEFARANGTEDALKKFLIKKELGDWEQGMTPEEQRATSQEYYDTSHQMWKVVTLNYITYEPRSRVFNRKTNQERVGMDFWPRAQQADFIMRQPNDSYHIREEWIPVCKTITTCPGLAYDLVLAEGYHPVQIGKLPFHIGSVYNFYGDRHGKVQDWIDQQVVVNKRESSASLYLDKTVRQSWAAEAGAFDDDAEMEREFRKNVNKTGQVLKVADGGLDKIKQLDTPRPPTDLWSSSERAEQYIKSGTEAAIALSGRSDGQRESALLYQQKVENGAVNLHDGLMMYKKLLQWMAEAHFEMARRLYIGAQEKMKSPKTDIQVTINESDEEGNVKNNIALIPRHGVIIEESRRFGNTSKLNYQKGLEFLQHVGNPILKGAVELSILIDSLPLSKSKQKMLRESGMLYMDFLTAQMQNQTAQNLLAAQQAEVQLGQQGQMAQPAQPGQPGAQGMDPKMIGRQPGGGPIPGENTLAGRQGASNNAPTDVVR